MCSSLFESFARLFHLAPTNKLLVTNGCFQKFLLTGGVKDEDVDPPSLANAPHVTAPFPDGV